MTTPHSPSETAGPFARFRSDHTRVLDRITELDAALGGEPLDEAPLRELVAHLGDQFATHMTAEDEVLYPALDEAFPEGRGVLVPLRADHAELRSMLAGIAQALGEPRSAWRDEQLVVIARDLVDLLRLHIHREESAVFDLATRMLSAAEIEALALRVRPYLEARSNPGAGAPVKGTPS